MLPKKWVCLAIVVTSEATFFAGQIAPVRRWPVRFFPQTTEKKQTSATNLAGDHGDQPGQQDRG